ncbi:MAG: hypothetical protein J6Y98_07085 [Bacteroidales bacterium]|nr:hypothetical protein [Bacteroidales bacterium]
MNIKRQIIILLMVVTPMLMVQAQQDSIVSMSPDLSSSLIPSERPIHQLDNSSKLIDTTRKWDFRLAMGGGIAGNKYNSATYSGITPTLIYRPSDKWTFKATASMMHSYSLAPNGYVVGGRNVHSLAPYRQPDATAGAVGVSATFKANDRLWIAASLLHMGGNLATASIVNPWLPDMPVTIDATAISASMRYRIGKDNYLDIHMTFVDDRAGTLSPLLFTSPLYGPCNYHSTSFGGYFF